jgi:glycerol kinase
MADLVGAVDQGTTSTRFMLFDHGGNEVGRHQLEHEQLLPRAGWVEHSPVEIWERTRSVIQTTMINMGLAASDLAALGITNQRETTVVWNKKTGRPYCNAIVWQDTRTDRIASALEREGKGDVIRQKAGLPRRRTSPVGRSSGFWRTSPASVPTPKPATHCSATPTAG